MNIRVSTVRRGDKVYRYAQLVQSYRREHDGKPTVRLIASLGELNDISIANIKAALAASKTGELLVLSDVNARASADAEVLQNLQYLPIAVLLRIWESLGLDRLIRENVPALTAMKADVERVLCALVLQRCVAPASKLAAERWFPETALPEWMAIAPGTFNNARIHRALHALEAGEASVQARLPALLESKEGEFGALFIDATDTWFIGQGPPLAAKGFDKEGIYRRRIGIALLCDARGFPLKWTTLPGKYHDATALVEMAAQAATLPWLQGKPIVLDRAVGKASYVDQLDATEARFVTALPHPEFATCGAPLDWPAIAALQELAARPPADEAAKASVERAAADAGFTAKRRDSFVRDLGIFSKKRSAQHHPSAAVAALQIVEYMRENSDLSVRDVAKKLGRSVTRVYAYRKLDKLAEGLQTRVLAGEADAVHLADLVRVAGLPATEQISAFEQAILDAPPDRSNRAKTSAILHPPPELRVRGVLTFKADILRQNIETEAENRRRLNALVDKINAKLGTGHSRRTDDAVLAEIGALIHRKSLGDVVTPEIQTVEGKRQLVVHHEHTGWARRRRAYGLTLIVTHRDVEGTANQIVDLYFSRDAAEKDFQTIKSALELRPVRHRTDAKVKAHVSLCMLALVLDRALGIRLKEGGSNHSPARAYEILNSVHLNRVKQDGREFYAVTKPSTAVTEILAALGMEDLGQTSQIRASITPR